MKFWTKKETEYWQRLYLKHYGNRKKQTCLVCETELQTWYEKRKKIYRCPECRVIKMRVGGKWRIL